ncbi:MAG: hypothetical protein ABIY70_00600 [Capsulimonas sp.]|uniref:hypothetical protein n=1 Tax=Capsulimonas sp. TaxID=2494211 RepID=UPI0032638DC7
MRFNKIGITVLAAAAISFAVLFALPSTGWIVRAQIRQTLHPTGDIWDLDKAVTLQTPSDDYAVQLASLPGDSAQRTQEARALEQRFPDRPSLYANAMRYATGGPVSLHRNEGFLIEGQTPPQNRVGDRPPTPMEDLSAFDRDAAAGERLDPNNAYFPAMRAIGLFAAHRDAEALATLHRAAGETQWREYYIDEVMGSMRRRELAAGPQSEVVRTAVFSAILFPHYARLRETARVATYAAVQAEMQGQTAEGARIRRDVMQVGGLLRAQSQTAIGTLVGISITHIALARPGGAPAIADKGNTADQERLEAYCQFLQNHRLSDNIAAVRAEFAAGVEARTIISSSNAFGDSNASEGPFSLKKLYNLLNSWERSWGILVNIAWLSFLGALASLAARSATVRNRKPLTRRRTAAIWCGVLYGVFTLAGYFNLLNGNASEPSVVVSLLMLTGAVLLAGALIWRLRGRWQLLGEAARDIAAAGALTFAAGFTAYTQAGALLGITRFAYDQFTGPSSDTASRFTQPAVWLLFAVPSAVLLISLIVGRVRRIPASSAIVLGLRRTAGAAVTAGFLLYGVSVLITIHDERVLRVHNSSILQGENQYLAQFSHQTWPGLTQWPRGES